MLAGWLTLAIMALPVIITASEESMRAIPKDSGKVRRPWEPVSG